MLSSANMHASSSSVALVRSHVAHLSWVRHASSMISIDMLRLCAWTFRAWFAQYCTGSVMSDFPAPLNTMVLPLSAMAMPGGGVPSVPHFVAVFARFGPPHAVRMVAAAMAVVAILESLHFMLLGYRSPMLALRIGLVTV